MRTHKNVIKFMGVNKTLNIADLSEHLFNPVWRFGSQAYLTYPQAVAMRDKHQLATSQLFEGETLVVY
jgi:hypothetical protein